MRKILKIQTGLIFLLFVTFNSLWAKKEVTNGTPLLGTAIAVSNSPSVTVTDKYFNESLTANYVNFKTNARVALSIDPQKTVGINNAATSVNVKISYWEAGASNPTTIPSTTLSVAYTNSGTYTESSYIDLGAAYKVEVTVIAPAPLNINAASVLSAEIAVERFYDIGSSTVNNLQNTPPDLNNNQLHITWNKVDAAESYDVEWTYVDNYLALQNGIDAVEITDLSKVGLGKNYFKVNSTRINTNKEFYDIPLIYERGYLIYRVRAVSYSLVSNIKTERFSAWTANDDIPYLESYPAMNRVRLDGFETKKNWQASINYAEEGKNKAAVTFADGTLRKRQDIIRLNTENKSMVGDVIYDHQGRPVINTLPVPTNSLSLNHRDNFSQNTLGNKYSRSDFDLDQVNNCNITTPPMKSTNSGAAQYYSSDNKFTNTQTPGDKDKVVNRDFIPNSGGYPFSQTKYMPDNTGRVVAMSIPGDTMMIGSGHETMMFYGTPTQEELVRVFGHDVGNAMHYKKNIVKDPNGQYSIAYIDMNGKTIMTSLAGVGPTALSKLPSNTASSTITVNNLLGDYMGHPEESPNKKTTDLKGYEFVTSLPIIGGSNYNIAYKATAGTYAPDVCDIQGTPKPCYSCVVEVETSLKDKPCADNQFTKSSFSIGTQNISPTCPSNITTSENLLNKALPDGSYVLSKKVKINEEKLEYYANEHLKTSCVKNLEFFINEESAKVDQSWCGITCTQCEAKFTETVGTYEVWKAQFPQDPGIEAYNNLKNETCAGFCDTKWNECSTAYKLMLSDMSPLGQYGEIFENSFKGGHNDELVTADADGNIVVNTDNNQGPGLDTDSDPNTKNDQNQALNLGGFNVAVHPLSIYNDSNVIAIRSIAVINNTKPSWRYPMTVNAQGVVTSFTYFEANGDSSLIMLLPDNAGNYIPKVADPSKVSMKQNGNYYTVPQNLQNVEDFATKYWKDSWAQSLVIYHPEYEYYKDCIANLASVQFDQKWGNAQSLADAVSKGLINSSATKFDPSTIDPYFLNANASDKAKIKHKLNFYGKDDMGVTSDIWTIVNKSVNCPTSKNCSLTNCNDLKIDSDDEWFSFRGQYTAAKQEILRDNAQKKAIVGTYYNGCIGNEYFDATKYGFSNFYIKSVPITVNRTCNIFQEVFLGCISGPITYDVSTPYIPALDPAQYCTINQEAYLLYKDKTKRFWQEYTGSGNLTNLVGSHCYDTIHVNGLVELVSAPCQEDLIKAGEELRNENSRKIYSTCGVCPVVWELQGFLNDMAVKNKLTQTTTDLSCPPSQGVASFTPLLERTLVSTNAALSSNKITYSSVLTSGNKGLSITLIEENVPAPSQPQLVLTIPASSPYDFTQISSICCVQITSTSNPTLSGKLFSAEGIVKVGTGIKKVQIDGMSSVALSPCQIPPRCLPSNKSVYLQNLLNALAATTGHLVTNNNLVDLVVTPQYNSIIRSLEDKTERVDPQNPRSKYVIEDANLNYKWSSTATSASLTGKLNATTDLVVLTTQNGASINFGKIVQFSNIRMEKCTTGDCTSHTFTIDAQFIDPVTRNISIVKLNGSAKYVMGNCKQAIQFEAQR